MNRFFITILALLFAVSAIDAQTVTLVLPENQAVNQPTKNLKFYWNKIEGTEFYSFQLATSATFTAGSMVEEKDVLDTTTIVNNLSNNTIYYWRVRAFPGSGDWSEVWSLTTTDLPTVPTLLFPENEAANTDTSLTLVWNRGEINASFRLELALDSDFGQIAIATNLEDTTYTLNQLLWNRRYYWRVKGFNIDGVASDWSEEFNFKTGLKTPVLLSPENGSRNNQIELDFDWTSVGGADRYIFQLALDSNFIQIDREAVTELSKYSVDGLLFDSTYYWRTRGFNAFGDSSKWSDIFSFGTTPGLIITPPSLVDTINFSEGDSDTLKGIEFLNLGDRDLFINEIFTDPDSIFSTDIEQITLRPTNSDTIYIRVDTTKVDSVVEFGSLNLVRVVSPTEVDTIVTKLQVLFQKAVAEFEIEELAFDTTQAASKKRLAFFIKNIEGNAGLRIDSLKISGRDTSAFSIASYSKITNAGDSTRIYVDFFPAKLDSNLALLTLFTNSYPFSVFEFPLSGVGKGGEVSDNTFERLEALSSETFETFNNNDLDFFVKNTGSDNIKISVTFWEKYFKIPNGETSNITIEPGDSVAFTVQYLTPNFDAENIDTMKIWHNGFGDSPIKVVLTGSFDSLKSTQLLKNNLKVNNSEFVEESYLFPEKTSIQFIMNSELMNNYDNLKFKINYFVGGPGFRKTANDIGDNRSVIPYNYVDHRGLIFAGQLDTKDSHGITVDSVEIFDYLDAQIIVGNFVTSSVVVPRSFVSSEPKKSDVKGVLFGFPFGDVVFDSLFLNLGGRENMTDGEWMVYGYDENSSNSYTQFADYYVEPNKGYFIAQSLEENLRFKYEYENDFITRQLKDSMFTLEGEGWKTVASPFTFPVEVDTPVTLLKWDTNNKSWRATSIMRPGEAYFVEPDYNELKMKSYGEYYPDLFPKILSPTGWGAKIKITDQNSESELFVGKKAETLNESEIAAGPRIQTGLRAYIANEKSDELLLKAKSFSDGAIWDLFIVNDLRDDYAILSVEEFGAARENYSTIFYDSAENKIIPDGSTIRLAKGVKRNIKLIAGTDEFIEKTIDEMVLSTPKQFALFNNYPNPFNPSTVIKYSIPEDGFVELKIFDILGRELRTLVSEDKNAGTYETRFDANGLASGIYFYRLRSGGKTAVKKLMLLK